MIQGEALGHAIHFAQRLRDIADEELVTPLENFVAAAYREPDLAEELDRADEDAEAEVDEETPSPSQQRQLLPSNSRILSCLAKWPLPRLRPTLASPILANPFWASPFGKPILANPFLAKIRG